jgi:hypothetical protein
MPHQLAAVEQERDGGPIELELHVAGNVFRAGDDERGDLDPTSFWANLRYDLRPADWVEILENWHYAKGLLLQIPAVDITAGTKRAVEQLERAAAAVTEGDYQQAVALCRRAMEAAYGPNEGSLHPELGYSVRSVKDADKEARFWLTRRGLWSLVHAANHGDEVTSTITWERRDAIAVIAILSAMLQQDPPQDA